MGQKQLFKDILTKNLQKLVRKNQISYLRSFMNPKQEHTHTHTNTELHHTQNAEDQKERGKILKQPRVGEGDILPSKEQKSD